MGHWHGQKDHPGLDGIKYFANKYYSAWKDRLTSHGLPYYIAIGDHELGDNPWKYPKALEYVKAYKQEFRKHVGMPLNGPEHMKGTAFWWRHRNVLFISVDVFEEGESGQGVLRAGVTDKQLEWFENVIKENPDVDHVIVMGHAPVLGPVRQWSSSGLMVVGGRKSEFWQMMAKRGTSLAAWT